MLVLTKRFFIIFESVNIPIEGQMHKLFAFAPKLSQFYFIFLNVILDALYL